MSLLRPVLNRYLRLTERSFLERAQDPVEIRASFERKARVFFRPPFGAARRKTLLAERAALAVTCGAQEGRCILYFHGGGYVFGSPRTHWAMLARLCKTARARAVLPDYRKAPEHPHPAAIEDALACYSALLDSGTPPGRIVLGGDSAGGGLALALLAELNRDNRPLPAGCFAFSPLTDMTYSGASITENAARDVVLPASRIDDMTEMFLGDQDRTDPRVSPLFARFDEAPPVWLTAGDSEILRDDSRRMAVHLREAGVDVTYVETHDLPHVWPIFQTFLPEARASLQDLGLWISQKVPPRPES